MTPKASHPSHRKSKGEKPHRPSLFRRWFPHPVLTLVLIGLWLSLNNSVSPGNVLVAIVLGGLIPAYTANFWPDRPKLRAPGTVVVFLVIFIWDVIVANLQVAYLVLFRSPQSLRTHWICIPLDLRQPEAITILCGTISLTPGTISSDLSADGKSLLVHCLDVENPAAEAQRIKARYERRLKAIFP